MLLTCVPLSSQWTVLPCLLPQLSNGSATLDAKRFPIFQAQNTNKVEVIQTKEVKEVKVVEKPKIEFKPVKENKLFINGIRKKPIQQVYFEKKKDINWNIVNKIKREGTVKFLYSKQPVKIENGEKIQTIEKIVEKIVEVEKEIDWNKFNEIDKKEKN